MTPQTISVDECNKIIDKLSDKTLSFGCILDIQDQNGYERRMIIDDVINTTKSIESWHEEDGTFHAIKINTIQKIIGHPVLLGDVLEKISTNNNLIHEELCDLLIFWMGCGFTRSLNQILDSAEKEKYCLGCDIFFDIDVDQKTYCQCGDLRDGTEQLKANTPASDLFIFLNQFVN